MHEKNLLRCLLWRMKSGVSSSSSLSRIRRFLYSNRRVWYLMHWISLFNVVTKCCIFHVFDMFSSRLDFIYCIKLFRNVNYYQFNDRVSQTIQTRWDHESINQEQIIRTFWATRHTCEKRNRSEIVFCLIVDFYDQLVSPYILRHHWLCRVFSH